MAAWLAKLLSRVWSLVEKDAGVRAEDQDDADDLLAGDQRQAEPGQQPQAGLLDDLVRASG